MSKGEALQVRPSSRYPRSPDALASACMPSARRCQRGPYGVGPRCRKHACLAGPDRSAPTATVFARDCVELGWVAGPGRA